MKNLPFLLPLWLLSYSSMLGEISEAFSVSVGLQTRRRRRRRRRVTPSNPSSALSTTPPSLIIHHATTAIDTPFFIDEASSSTQIRPSLAEANVLFVSGSAPSDYGLTSPEPNPTWSQVALQLAKRLPNFAQRVEEGSDEDEDIIDSRAVEIDQLTSQDLDNVDILVVLGVAVSNEEDKLTRVLTESNNELRAILCDPTCGDVAQAQQFAGSYRVSDNGLLQAIGSLFPWSKLASHQRLLEKTELLLARKSSEDYLFAILFALHSLVTPIAVVASDINPSWEKGIWRNAQEFKTMVDCCGPQIQAAITDPQSKHAIDQLNALDLRDQVGSYRVIVSNETPQLEDFTLCILQQNNCFRCNSPILTKPKVPLMETWQGKPVDALAAKQILMGHLKHEEAAACSQQHPWSWKIVVGANPAYDAFPQQHQIFYPSGNGNSKKLGDALWYDPVFCVETLQGGLVWCKRHYRCTPRKHWSGRTTGAWTLTTLDNGMVSEEHWTTVDAADDLSWAVLHYSGAAKRAGQSYVGALLCTADGLWPATAKASTLELERIRAAFRKCDLELWELFGGSTTESFMWSSQFTEWAKQNPPPLEPIGDISITAWRKRERETQEQQR